MGGTRSLILATYVLLFPGIIECPEWFLQKKSQSVDVMKKSYTYVRNVYALIERGGPERDAYKRGLFSPTFIHWH